MDRREVRKGRVIQKKSKLELLIYIATIIFSVLFLFIGNSVATKGLTVFNGDDFGETVVKAKIEAITDRISDDYSLAGDTTMVKNVQVTFEATLLDGEEKGERVTGTQIIDGMLNIGTPEVEQGDKVLLVAYEGQPEMEWQFMEFVRTDKLLIFGLLFILALLVFGGIKGLNTILSLVFTCAAIFMVFIPAILSGKNIYLSAIVICLYTIVATYLIINGFNKKTLTAILGCFGGILVSGILTIIVNRVLELTGYVDEESIYLTYISTGTPIDLKAIIFAAILIGALGAIMDVSMSISSSLWEVKEKSGATSFNTLFRSGMNIGRDVMGTMANTLILAYIGSSLSIVLLLSAYSTSLIYLLNREMIVVEILQALVGSFGILFAMPLTSFICAIIYKENSERIHDEPSVKIE
ncbi:YibE/F family protein [Desulfitobacterium hafniense]|nr:YibE/F family protein [Desulfitobacterium hafniense]ACL22243.1 YibE/F family protein [Desulfitobacterium hafniense DCB-2]EHL04658.1 YibE/F-like protein [Desulfitobacterium hafniense DP7]MEA5021344.1 YibE/F family protein [Desulfitobacterium hafniense]